jgi:hypothetical protein
MPMRWPQKVDCADDSTASDVAMVIKDGNFMGRISNPMSMGMEDRSCPWISWGGYPITNGWARKRFRLMDIQ